MAGNRFDFELVAKDEASATVQGLEAAVAKLLPDLDKAGDKIQLGGKKSIEGLDDLGERLSKMSTFAKTGVQYFGDMVPPLKMAGELAGKYGGALAKMGVGGAAVYGAGQAVYSLVKGLAQAGKAAYDLDVQAKNAGMSVHDLTQVAGGMEILGANTDAARASVEALSRSLTDAMNNRNSPIVGVLNQIGVPIVQRADHTADTMKTLENLAEIFPTISPQKQKTVADALGLTPEMLALLRQGLRYKQLMAESDKYGLTMTDAQIDKLKDVNTQYSELEARLAGMWRRTNIFGKIASASPSFDHSDAAMKSVSDSQKYDKDDSAHFYHSDRVQDILHRARRDPAFKKDLSFTEGLELAGGKPGKALQAKLDARYLASWRAQALLGDVNTVDSQTPGITADKNLPPLRPGMFSQRSSNALGLRDNNPGNLRAAPNTSGSVSTPEGNFSQFATPVDGLAALSRQLMLYGDRGKTTLDQIIPTYAPSGENNTAAYTADVASKTGFSPDQPLDLHSPAVLERLMPAMISHEQGVQPFSLADIDRGINDSIVDPRWRGGRNPEYLMAKRGQNQGGEQPGIIAPDQTAELTKALREIVAQAGKDGKTQLEVKLTGANGEQKRVQVPFGGRVSTSMNQY